MVDLVKSLLGAGIVDTHIKRGLYNDLSTWCVVLLALWISVNRFARQDLNVRESAPGDISLLNMLFGLLLSNMLLLLHFHSLSDLVWNFGWILVRSELMARPQKLRT